MIENSRVFYEKEVAPMIREYFPAYEDRIAAGLAGEGSDCFGYDDLVSRDHDFGTGVCLWLADEVFEEIGNILSIRYHELANRHGGGELSRRLQERRGVMTIHGFYSSILGVDCDTDGCKMSEEKWFALDHSCLATAVNGEVFRDGPGIFSAFRKLLLNYYPDRIWRIRIVNELHRFSASLQVNYARCMTRGDLVAAELCRMRGLEAAMELWFLLRRTYPPYYKWTFRALQELDPEGRFARLIRELAGIRPESAAWAGETYHPNRLNLSDRAVVLTEEIAAEIVKLLNELGLIQDRDPYLERYVDPILKGTGS